MSATIYYGLLRDIGENAAGLFIKEYYKLAIDFDMNIIERAAGMKLKYKNRNLSMTDCVGYCLAQQWGIRFLTGDKEFEGTAGVEFVK